MSVFLEYVIYFAIGFGASASFQWVMDKRKRK